MRILARTIATDIKIGRTPVKKRPLKLPQLFSGCAKPLRKNEGVEVGTSREAAVALRAAFPTSARCRPSACARSKSHSKPKFDVPVPDGWTGIKRMAAAIGGQARRAVADRAVMSARCGSRHKISSRSLSYARSPISARSRNPIKVSLSIESSSWRASSADSTGVLPRLTTYLGPRTELAGLEGRIPPVTR